MNTTNEFLNPELEISTKNQEIKDLKNVVDILCAEYTKKHAGAGEALVTIKFIDALKEISLAAIELAKK